MQEIPKELKQLLFGMGAKWHAWASIIQNILGIVCLVMGIISGAMDKALWLEPTYWFLAAIAFIVFALSAWLTAHNAAKEG